jgi:hypothetical protein
MSFPLLEIHTRTITGADGPHEKMKMLQFRTSPAVDTNAAFKKGGDIRHAPLAALGESYTEAGVGGRGKEVAGEWSRLWRPSQPSRRSISCATFRRMKANVIVWDLETVPSPSPMASPGVKPRQLGSRF